jgi:Leucine rich repeat variant
MATADQRTSKFVARKVFRGTQVIFGERKHLREVLRSLQSARFARARKQSETRALRKLIAARTAELERIAPQWDRKFRRAQNSRATPRELARLAEALAPNDYLLARVLSEHPAAPPEMLERLAAHPYAAVRENVARHPRTPAPVLRQMAADAREPLWFLVACNPSAPADLREKLRARMQQAAGTP